MYVCVRMYVYVCMYVCMYVYVCMYMYVCIRMYVYVCMYVCVNVRVYVLFVLLATRFSIQHFNKKNAVELNFYVQIVYIYILVLPHNIGGQ